MPTPRPMRSKKNLDHVIDVVAALEDAERAIDRISDARLSDDARDAVRRLKGAIRNGKSAAADAIETMSEGALTRAPATRHRVSADEGTHREQAEADVPEVPTARRRPISPLFSHDGESP